MNKEAPIRSWPSRVGYALGKTLTELQPDEFATEVFYAGFLTGRTQGNNMLERVKYQYIAYQNGPGF